MPFPHLHPIRDRLYFAAPLCALVVGFWSTGCTPKETALARPDTFIFARGSDAQKLDPADVDDGESVKVLTQVCEGLLRFRSGTVEVEPCLAESYDVSPDGLTYTFHLREGVTFHDGTPLNAETAAWSFHRQMDPNHPGHLPEANFQYWNYLYQDVAEVRVTGPMALELQLSQPNASLLASLAVFPAYLISPQALSDWGADFQRHPVGTGPYQFESWVPNQAVTLSANHDYWDESTPPQFDRVVLKVVPENSVRLLDLKAGNIHGLDGIAPAEIAELEKDDRLTVYRETGLNVGYLTFNLRYERFQDPEVRLAFALAIDRAKLAAVALEGSGTVADYPLPPGFLGYPEEPDRISYDPERAKSIFARHSAAFATPVRLQVMTAPRPYLPEPVQATSFIRSELEKAGLRVEIVARDFKSHLDSLRNFDFEVGIIGWNGDNGDTDNFLSIFFGSWATEPGSASNYADYKNPEMDDLLLAARQSVNVDERAALYERALALWRRDLPIIPLVHGDNVVVLRREITGFEMGRVSDLLFGPIGWEEE